MFVSEYIIKKLRMEGTEYVFGVTGTSVNMLFVTLERQDGIDYICPLHEQGGSFGADGYARVSGKLGVAIATSGPGATNMLTGCAGAYTDGIPVLYIFGQAAQSGIRGKPRFFGFQETDLATIYKPVTKYSKEVSEAKDIRYEIEKSVHIAEEGRKGPVALVIPENVLYEQIEENDLIGFRSLEENQSAENFDFVEECILKLKKADRPLFLFGAGIHRANAEHEAVSAARVLNIPVAMSYPARDLMDDDDPLNVGSIGVFGSKSGNVALAEADIIVAVGVRFDRQMTGNPAFFCRDAKIILVDIDQNEIEKLSDIGIDADGRAVDAKCFLKSLYELGTNEGIIGKEEWISCIHKYAGKFPIYKLVYEMEDKLNPYVFMDRLSQCLDSRDIIFSDTGLSTVWIGQSFRFKNGQRWHTQFSYSAMGYALPAAIGGSFASNGRMICICGDGGLQMSIEELSCLAYHKRNIKVFVIVNQGYGMIQKTQDDFSNGHAATDREHHVPLPDSLNVAKAYGLNCYEIKTNGECLSIINSLLSFEGPAVCFVHIPMEKKIQPRVKAGHPLYEIVP